MSYRNHALCDPIAFGVDPLHLSFTQKEVKNKNSLLFYKDAYSLVAYKLFFVFSKMGTMQRNLHNHLQRKNKSAGHWDQLIFFN